ncbi:hypothetical protein CYLTODRAFT_426816 [Cylindrobasidium torrendii FP15055 ss-10]|uniref:Uncharacterized protein n=1 Tax=Cylindrobasidium torrendii FP15055 ss-10 TaxID=1314674 RepID=A0A0D7AX44_9AGAR|nr:hypothetical protein CYLTODRAFT_426816 [Cylindrobasidium torrendii FP15055 ss-10]
MPFFKISRSNSGRKTPEKDGQKSPLRVTISSPMPMGSTSLTGIESNSPSATRSVGSSSSSHSGAPTSAGQPTNVAWMSVPHRDGQMMARVPIVIPPPPVHGHFEPSQPQLYPAEVSRSASLPNASSDMLRLRLDPSSASLEVPITYQHGKPLSPIEEQDYFSPDSSRRSRGLPEPSPSSSTSSTAVTINRPSPSITASHSPFISRPLNRSGSGASSRTHTSTVSTVQSPVGPPLECNSSTPASNPGVTHDTQGLRSHPGATTLPTIQGSVEGADSIDNATDSSVLSQRAESFHTASGDSAEIDLGEIEDDGFRQSLWKGKERETMSSPPSVYFHSTPIQRQEGLVEVPSDAYARPMSGATLHSRSPPSTSDSFIHNRWDRFKAFYSPFDRPENNPDYGHPPRFTPAFWTFWLGFFCPFLWLIGGWHFSNFGEIPPKMTFWEFYFDAGYWKVVYGTSTLWTRRKSGKEAMLPQWTDEKQAYHDQIARMHERKGSMKRRGFLFGYPFVPRPPPSPPSWASRVVHGVFSPILRFFDQLYGMKLVDIRGGREETDRRMFDPWIQRCRYALCYLLVFGLLATVATATVLLVVNIRDAT